MSRNFTSRAWQGPVDTVAIRNMLRDRYRVQGPPSYPSASDFDFWLATTSNQAVPNGIQLWFEGEALVGYAWPSTNEIDFITHPHGADAEGAMLAWAQAHLRATPPTEGAGKAWCFDTGDTLAALLTSAGYVRTDEYLSCMVFSMEDALPSAPPLPAGYAVRSLRGPEEAEARSAAHRMAFPDWPMTAAAHIRAMHTETYHLDLDMVATAPDGTIVATAIVWYDPALRMGLFEPIGCHPDHQTRGLATGCISEGLRRLKARGAQVAVVCGWRDDSDGSRLYRKLGFRERERRYLWEPPPLPEREQG